MMERGGNVMKGFLTTIPKNFLLFSIFFIVALVGCAGGTDSNPVVKGIGDLNNPCFSNGTCNGSLVCNGSKICVERIPNLLCSSDTDCSDNETCQNGTCKAVSQRCTQDSDCNVGEICQSDGTCTTSGDDTKNKIAMAMNSIFVNGTTVQCGKSFSINLSAKDGSGDLKWTVDGLPDWATGKSSGDRNLNYTITGTLPYDKCDLASYNPTIKVCDDNGDCIIKNIEIKMRIPHIGMSGSIPSEISAIIGISASIPKLKVKTGSGRYRWKTIIPKDLIGETEDKVIEQNDYFRGYEFIPKKIGNFKVTVKACDKAFDEVRDQIANKLNKDADEIVCTKKNFNFNVTEDGFLLSLNITDAKGGIVGGVFSSNSQKTNLTVAYDQDLKLSVMGRAFFTLGPDYATTYKVDIRGDSDKILNGGSGFDIKGGTSFSLIKRLDRSNSDLKLKNIKIVVRNPAEKTEALTIDNIVIKADPCKNIVIKKARNKNGAFNENDVFYYNDTLNDGDFDVPISGGRGPFVWNIVSTVVASKDDFSPNSHPPSQKISENGKNLNFKFVTPEYGTLDDRWGPSRVKDNGRTFALSGDFYYPNVGGLLNVKNASYGAGSHYYDLYFVEVLDAVVIDKGCKNKTERRQIYLHVNLKQRPDNTNMKHQTTCEGTDWQGHPTYHPCTK